MKPGALLGMAPPPSLRFPLMRWGCLLLVLLGLGTSVAFGREQDHPQLDARLSKLVSGGCVLVGHQEAVLYRYPRGCNPELIPASLLKIANALAALELLGPEYRFPTEVYAGADGRLGVRGYGDPFLVSETWEDLADQLATRSGVSRSWSGLFLDPSAFDPELNIPGLESSLDPYNAKIGSLASNFNTVFVEVNAQGEIRSAEPQTPLTNVAIELARELEPGKHRINITQQPGRSLEFTAELARAFLQQAGLRFEEPGFTTRPVSAADVLLLRYENPRPLHEVVAGMLQYSNNFIANQLLLAMGRSSGSREPASLGRGLRQINTFLQTRMGWAADSFRVVEGSGIARDNRMTPEMVLDLLRAFSPYRKLMPVEKGVLLKTGTLKGIYNIAGYFPEHEDLFFVVMLEQPRNYRNAVMKHLLRTPFSSAGYRSSTEPTGTSTQPTE